MATLADSRLIAMVSCPQDEADRLARRIIESKLAACVNCVPNIRSTYRWQGRIEQENESLLLIKTTAAGFDALKAKIVNWHPYELPEVIAVEIIAGHTPYLDWISRCVDVPAN